MEECQKIEQLVQECRQHFELEQKREKEKKRKHAKSCECLEQDCN